MMKIGLPSKSHRHKLTLFIHALILTWNESASDDCTDIPENYLFVYRLEKLKFIYSINFDTNFGNL